MIETLVEAEPRALVDSLSFTDIDFGTDDFLVKRMDRPRYESLINYDRAPAGVQFEPSFQIRANPETEIQIEFQINKDVPIALQSNGAGGVECQSIDHPNLPLAGLVSNELFDPKHCRLTWKQANENVARKLTVLRLRCVRTDGMSLTNTEKVEGGLFLAIVNRQQAISPLTPAVKEPGPVSDSTITVLGIDTLSRPVYDLFKPDQQVPDHLELEPAFRVREGAQVAFRMVLDLPASYNNVIFLPDLHGHVDVVGYNPEGRPPQLRASGFGAGFDPKVCALRWMQEIGRSNCTVGKDARECYCTHGYASTFYLRSTQWQGTLEDLERFLREGNMAGIANGIGPTVAEFDPTVIQPPVCTVIGGETVCTQ